MASAWFEGLMLSPLQTKGLLVSNAVLAFPVFGFICDTETVTNAWIGARTAGIMVTWTNEDPTATSGILIPANKFIQLAGWSAITKLRFLREAAADANVTIVLER